MLTGLTESFNHLTFDAAEIDRRVRAPLDKRELVALTIAVAFVIGLLIVQPRDLHSDLDNYLRTAHGDFRGYYYGYWLLPLFALLSLLPVTLVYILWSLLTIVAVFYAARVFGGATTFVIISFQLFYVLFQGQVTGVLLGALGLMWWAMAHKRWELAGAALIVAATKFQTGMTLGLLLWFFAGVSWRERIRVLVIPVLVVALTFIANPHWPLDLQASLEQNPPGAVSSLALWRWLGPASLLFAVPPLLFPLSHPRRVIALAVTVPLVVPYYQQADLITLFALPVGWLPALVGQFGYFILAFDYLALQLLVIIPLLVYALVFYAGVRDWLSHKSRSS